MSENDLARALLQLDGGLPALPDMKALTQSVLERDQRKVRRLYWLTVLLWLGASALVVFVFVMMGLVMPLQAKFRMELEQGKMTERQYSLAQLKTHVAAQMLTLAVAGSVMVLGMASFLTLIFVQASRRATLRQVSASLLEISEQLKQLRQAVEVRVKPGG